MNKKILPYVQTSFGLLCVGCVMYLLKGVLAQGSPGWRFYAYLAVTVVTAWGFLCRYFARTRDRGIMDNRLGHWLLNLAIAWTGFLLILALSSLGSDRGLRDWYWLFGVLWIAAAAKDFTRVCECKALDVPRPLPHWAEHASPEHSAPAELGGGLIAMGMGQWVGREGWFLGDIELWTFCVAAVGTGVHGVYWSKKLWKAVFK